MFSYETVLIGKPNCLRVCFLSNKFKRLLGGWDGFQLASLIKGKFNWLLKTILLKKMKTLHLFPAVVVIHLNIMSPSEHPTPTMEDEGLAPPSTNRLTQSSYVIPKVSMSLGRRTTALQQTPWLGRAFTWTFTARGWL